MDKSESELLADWDVVSPADTEQVNDSIDAKPSSSTTNNDSYDNANDKTETSVKGSESVNDVITVDNKSAVESEKSTEPDTEQANEADVVSEHTSEASAEEISELVTVIEQISEVEAIIEQNSELDDIAEQETDADSEEVTKEVVANIVDSTVKSSEPDSVKTTAETIKKIDGSSDRKTYNDRQTEEILSGNNNVTIDTNAVDNCEDRATSSSLDSSMEHIQIEYCGASRVQDIPELIDLVEQDNAAIESSSSDIDIIDDNMEESFGSSFVHPLALSISSSIDTSSMMTSPLETEKEIKIEKETEHTSTIKTDADKEAYRRLGFSMDEPVSYLKPDSSFTTKSEASSETPERFQKSNYSEQEREGTRNQDQRSPPRQAGGGLFGTIKGFLRNMTHFEWSLLGGVMLCLYVTVVFNQTNIFAVVERENVVSQMKQMINELKQDNKMLKDQMLSEMKNEKVFSSVEHQIKELKKENSKLNHMLYDVVKVLEEQKDPQEKFKKKEPDYATPFKKEINKLKEHINILKIDNEDLQKQLVRMRYASYSQGGTDKTEEKAETHKEEIKPDETFTDEIPLDINSLKKWNELITLLSKELGLSSENGPISEEKPHSKDFKDNISWYWKGFLREFKGTFKDFKENVTSIFSDYKQANEKAVSEIYRFVKEFFTVEENNHQFTPPAADSSQWKNIGDFVNDLKEKWTNIKDRIYASDLKDFLKNFRKSREADWPSEKTKSEEHESYDRKPTDFERKPTTVNFESEQKATTEPDRKYGKIQTNPENAKWMFKRAELRAELRDTEEEDPSENWFLKRKRQESQDDGEKFRY